ncbi:hypothetical protein [Actinomadura kijaniata]|uniref:hypothetical protein n=1 Tax=Actinomadura kijaniata TaxID=46161 RepID=UPI0008376779|nr:hypothetical protein [Actinomadura kijaniata]
MNQSAGERASVGVRLAGRTRFVQELAQGWRLVVGTPWIVCSIAGSTLVVTGALVALVWTPRRAAVASNLAALPGADMVAGAPLMAVAVCDPLRRPCGRVEDGCRSSGWVVAPDSGTY